MTPSKEELQAKARHFANTVFVIGAGVLMLAASLLQPIALNRLGGAIGEHLTFIVATVCIVVLAAKRPQLALFALERQCDKYGHSLREGSSICDRCLRTIPKSGR